MRKALQRIGELYSTSPVFQDLIETAGMTGTVAIGQALTTDMTPQEIALSGAAGAGAAMIGRPIFGKVGETFGGVLDRNFPEAEKAFSETINDLQNIKGIGGKLVRAKLNPYEKSGGMGKYFGLMGRGMGDNIVQGAVGIAAPFLLPNNEQQSEGTVMP